MPPSRFIALYLIVPLQTTALSQITLTPDSYTIAQGSRLVADGTAPNPPGVLANDTGVGALPEGQLKLKSPPLNGTVVLLQDGSFIYRPHPNFFGTDTFTYQVENPEPIRVIDEDTTWKILHPLDARSPALDIPGFFELWTRNDFDDSEWLTGSGLIGYGEISNNTIDTDIGTPPGEQRFAAYLRTTFLSPAAGRYNISTTVRRDDGCIAYWNGVGLFRTFEPAVLAPTAAVDDYYLNTNRGNDYWTDGSEESDPHDFRFEDVEIDDHSITIAVSLHNTISGLGASSTDLGFKMDHLDLSRVELAEVTVRVAPVETNPSGRPDWFFTLAETTFSSAETGRGILANDAITDSAGNTMVEVVELLTDTTQLSGTLTTVPDSAGHFEFDPSLGFAGLTSFTYQIRSRSGLSEPVPVYLFVGEISLGSDPLVAVAGSWASLPLPAQFNFPAVIGRIPDRGRGHVVTNSLGERSIRYYPRELAAAFSGTLSTVIGLEQAASLPSDTDWKFLHPLDGVDPKLRDIDFDSTWFTAGFDDSDWSTGSGYLGYNVVSPGPHNIGLPASVDRFAAYFRKSFTLDSIPSAADAPSIFCFFSGAAIVYLNGVEIARYPRSGLGADSFYLRPHRNPDATGALVAVPLNSDLLRTGENVVAASLHPFSTPTGSLWFGSLGGFSKTVEFPTNVEAITRFTSWVRQFFNDQQHSTPEFVGPHSDPDGDSHDNLIEYAFGSSPSDPGDRPDLTFLHRGSPGIPGSLFPPETVPDIPADVVLEVQRRPSPGAHWVTIAVQHGEMRNWLGSPQVYDEGLAETGSHSLLYRLKVTLLSSSP